MPCFLWSLWEQMRQTVFYLIARKKKKKLRLGEVKTLTKVMELGCGRLVGSQEEL